MRLCYGADPANFRFEDEVELHVLRTLKEQRRVVYDESNRDAVTTEVELEVIAALNPAAISYAGEIGVQPTRIPGQRALVTARAIGHKMLEERRVLRWLSDEPGIGEVLQTKLQSPAPVLPGETPYTCDVLGGPYPQDFHVVAFWGQPKTIIVYYRIKTYVNECRQSENHPIISHRWGQTSDTDVDQFSTRITEGTVYFNVAELVRRGQIPDQFRRDLTPGVPQNFQREHARVLVTPDGSQLRYTIVDREKSHLFNNTINATRIEAYHTEHAHQPSIAGVRTATARGVLAAAANLAIQGLSVTREGVAAFGVAIPAQTALLTFDTTMAQQPTFESSIFIRIWGNRLASRTDLARLAFSIAVARLENPAVLNLLPSRDLMLTRDLYGIFVEFQLKIGHPPSINSLFSGMPAINLNDNELIVGTGGTIDPADGNTNPRFLNSEETRGTWVGRLFAQALGEACGNPLLPVTVGKMTATDNTAELSGRDF